VKLKKFEADESNTPRGSLISTDATTEAKLDEVNTLQHTATHWNSALNTLQQLTATHFNTLQHTAATHCNTLQHTTIGRRNTLHHTTTHCNTLQHTAAHYTTLNTPQHTVTHCNTPQHTATHCNIAMEVCRQLPSPANLFSEIWSNSDSEVYIIFADIFFPPVLIYD